MYNKSFVQAYQMAPTYIPNSLAKKPLSVRQSLGPVDRSMANVETEGGETVFLPDKEGLPAHYRIHGPRHYEGGVPMNIPPDSFVFSDTKSMRIKDADLLKEFGMPASNKGYTPAEIAKKYDINKFRRILQDPDSDKLQIQTAELNIANFQIKLGKLALIQESMKGFPGGIPLVAMPYLAKYNIDPAMILPTDLQSAGEGQMPMARYGGSMSTYQVGGQVTPEQEAELNSLPSNRQIRKAERRARRDAERNYLVQLYTNLLTQVVSESTVTKEEKPDPSTGIFYRQDSNGNPYYVDGRGIRVKSFDSAFYGQNNLPTTKEGERIIERDGKRYRVTTKKTTNIDLTKVVHKDKAVSTGDIYLETDGKYYQIGKYDINKPIRATKSGQQIDPAQFEQNKGKALEILNKLENQKAAVYHDKPFKVGNETRNPGWEIKDSAKSKLNTEEKEFLTDFFSVGKANGQIGAGTPELNVSLQGSGDSGFYGYTDSDFYEYRFWKAKNQDKTGADWNNPNVVTNDEKRKNRKEMLYNLGFDISDPHIAANIENPEKLYSKDFISGRKVAKLDPKRVIKDRDGKEYSSLGFADAVESYFADEDFRPSLGSDKKLGLEHADAFTYDKPITQISDEEVTTEEEIKDVVRGESPKYTRSGSYSPWWLQDIIKTSGALQDLYSIKRYKPYKPTYTPYVPQPTFYDPSREIAAIQETAGMAADVARGMGTSAQSMGARLAAIQGTAAESIANTMGRYNNLNVGVSNEFAYKKTDILNEATIKNQQFTKQYVDEFNTLNQNYDNAKRMARGNLRQAYIDAVTNRAQAQVLNQLYPNYIVDPSTGGFMNFRSGMPMMADENAGQASAMTQNANAFVQWKNQHPDISEESAVAIWNANSRLKPQQYSAQQNFYNAYSNAIPNDMFVQNPGPGNYYTDGQGYKKGGLVPFAYTVGYTR
jgi:hypothetical protein